MYGFQIGNSLYFLQVFNPEAATSSTQSVTVADQGTDFATQPSHTVSQSPHPRASCPVHSHSNNSNRSTIPPNYHHHHHHHHHHPHHHHRQHHRHYRTASSSQNVLPSGGERREGASGSTWQQPELGQPPPAHTNSAGKFHSC